MNSVLRVSKSFKKDYKKLSRKEIEETDLVIKKLLAGELLEEKYKDHALHGNYVGYRECHVKPDLLLVYTKTITGELLLITVYRISSHSNIFGIRKGQ